MKFSKASGALPRTPLGGLQRPPDPQLEKGRATHGLSCFARLSIVLLFTFFVLRPDQFPFRCYGPEQSARQPIARSGKYSRRAYSRRALDCEKTTVSCFIPSWSTLLFERGWGKRGDLTCQPAVNHKIPAAKTTNSNC